jgi:hypothetical protein
MRTQHKPDVLLLSMAMDTFRENPPVSMQNAVSSREIENMAVPLHVIVHGPYPWRAVAVRQRL